jgi:predicted transposase YbfD/YdcC
LELRQIWTSTELNDYLDFPHVQQVFAIERTRRKLDGSLLSHEVVYGLTSRTVEKASPAQILAFNRGHWSIENKLHWVRDVTFDEDRSQVRKGRGAHLMATLRNIAISLLRLAGAKNIAAALRRGARNMGQALRLVGF